MHRSTRFVGGLTISSCKILLRFKVLQIDSIIFRVQTLPLSGGPWQFRFKVLWMDPLSFLWILTIQGGKSSVFTYHQFSCSKNLYIPPRDFLGYLWNCYQLAPIECCHFVDQLPTTSLLVQFCCRSCCPSSRVGSGSVFLKLIAVPHREWVAVPGCTCLLFVRMVTKVNPHVIPTHSTLYAFSRHLFLEWPQCRQV